MDDLPMRVQIKTPAGALTRPEVEALARMPGSIIYKVFGPIIEDIPISKLCVASYDKSKDFIDGAVGGNRGCHIAAWFSGGRRIGYLFSNYFHALAYSLQCKNKEPA
jgi:hypothetical protein